MWRFGDYFLNASGGAITPFFVSRRYFKKFNGRAEKRRVYPADNRNLFAAIIPQGDFLIATPPIKLFFQEDQVDLRTGEKAQRQNRGADAVADDDGAIRFNENSFTVFVIMPMGQIGQ